MSSAGRYLEVNSEKEDENGADFSIEDGVGSVPGGVEHSGDGGEVGGAAHDLGYYCKVTQVSHHSEMLNTPVEQFLKNFASCRQFCEISVKLEL